ncbi:hypothetical protein NCCP2145_14130 [Pseudarthrobacter sp. NCCP-2145]|nr:hypothetical protein NCCP2145_14130 [Pseudarthrobacter sp. NCCP-2145]
MVNASSYTPLTDLEAEQFIRSVYLARREAATVAVMSWTAEGYRQAIEQSSLKAPVKRTLHAMVNSAAGDRTTIDRATLCLLTGIRVESTITEHFRKARAAGLLESQRRFNNSSIHTLLIPGVVGSADAVQAGRPINWHCWTVDEIAWWDGLDPEKWTPPPWHPWPGYWPPF